MVEACWRFFSRSARRSAATCRSLAVCSASKLCRCAGSSEANHISSVVLLVAPARMCGVELPHHRLAVQEPLRLVGVVTGAVPFPAYLVLVTPLLLAVHPVQYGGHRVLIRRRAGVVLCLGFSGGVMPIHHHRNPLLFGYGPQLLDQGISGEPCLVGAGSICFSCSHVIAVVLDWIVLFVPSTH